jgi:farnesyl-diphosphate farnesyltransferase
MRYRVELGQAEQNYLSKAMDKVSRSFAVVVAHLEEPLSHYLATAYLIYRVVDNIEDCGRSARWQEQRFGELCRLLDEPALAPEVLASWQDHKWPALTSDELALMGVSGGAPLWRIYGNLPEDTRATLRQWVGEMVQGMQQLAAPDLAPVAVEHKGVRILKGEQDYNRYCYYVAGTVGHLGTELVIAHYGLDKGVAAKLRDSCEACGRGLQKTNIVKDFVKDRRNDICYLPGTWLGEVAYAPLRLAGAPAAWKKMVLADVVQELHQSLDHVLSLPRTARGYRMASLLCLLPALETIRLAAQCQDELFTPNHNVKISKMAMMKCIHTARSIWDDDRAIEKHCRGLEDAIGSELHLTSSVSLT